MQKYPTLGKEFSTYRDLPPIPMPWATPGLPSRTLPEQLFAGLTSMRNSTLAFRKIFGFHPTMIVLWTLVGYLRHYSATLCTLRPVL